MKPTIRAVLDTNIVISSLWGGVPYKIIDLWQKGNFLAVISFKILQEYEMVLKRFNVTDEDMSDFMEIFTHPKKTTFVIPKVQHDIIKDDPSDNMFIDCAIAGKGNYIISGDSHLLKLKEFKNIQIIKPSKFIQLLK